VAKTLGLDSAEHWIRVEELNRFTWPGYDLWPIPGSPGQYEYGLLPQGLYEALRTAILERRARAGPKVHGRD
jgi:hypothetical protein